MIIDMKKKDILILVTKFWLILDVEIISILEIFLKNVLTTKYYTITNEISYK